MEASWSCAWKKSSFRYDCMVSAITHNMTAVIFIVWLTLSLGLAVTLLFPVCQLELEVFFVLLRPYLHHL